MTVAVGLDVGTTGVKALAVTPSGDIAAQAEHGYPLSTPHPGWSEQDPEDWWRAAETALAEVSAGHEVAESGSPDRCTDSSRSTTATAAASGDPLERPTDRCRMRGDRGAGRPRTPDRAHGQPSAPRLHRPEAPLAPSPRARQLRPHLAHLPPKDYVRLRLTGSWAIDVADARARCSSTSPGALEPGSRSTRSRSPSSGSRPLSSPRTSPGRRRPASRSRRAPVIDNPRRSGWGSPGPGRPRSYSGPPVWSSPLSPSTGPTIVPACTSLSRGSRCLGGDGGHALGGGVAPVAPRHDRPGPPVRRPAGRGRALGAGGRGTPVPPVPAGREDATRRPRRARRIHRTTTAPRSRSARACRARRGRLRAA